MRRGFTILELLVASLLLGMLVTILTMIFNQSSIAWRIGIAGISDLGDSRYTIGLVREAADNAFVYNNRGYRHIGVFDRQGGLRRRACAATDGTLAIGGDDQGDVTYFTKLFFDLPNATVLSPGQQDRARFQPKSVGSGSGNQGYQTLFVNVKSGGPKNDIEDYQAIWSSPDDPQEW